MRKQYRWHTGYPGGLKEINPQTLREHKPEEVEELDIFYFSLFSLSVHCLCLRLVQILRKAVHGMLPKNKLRARQGLKLRIFPGTKHFHEDLVPQDSPSVIV
jgi:large subunit ribosomal protein L13